MSSINLGSQSVTFDYQQPAKANQFNKLTRSLIKPGFYSGGAISNVGNEITIAPFQAYFNCNNDVTLGVNIKTTENVTQTASLNTLTYFVMSYEWANTTENWIDFSFKAVGDLEDTDIIICTLGFTGSTVTSTSTNLRTYGLFDENYEIASDLVFNRTTESTSSSTGAVVVKGGVGIAKNLNVGANIKIAGTTDSTTKDTGAVIVEGGVGIEKNLNFGGVLNKQITIDADTTLEVNTTYYLNSATSIALTLPATALQGQTITVIDLLGVNNIVTPNNGQKIIKNYLNGVDYPSNFLQLKEYGYITLCCMLANTTWVVSNYIYPIYSKGYILGGTPGGITFRNVIEDMNFYTFTSVQISAVLSENKAGTVGVSGLNKGYVMGGNLLTYSAVIEGLSFFTEASAVIIATLDTARAYGAGVSGLNKGYMMGGADVDGNSAVIEDLNFSTEASAAIVATLDTAKAYGTGVYSNTKGYCMGGRITAGSAYVNVIEDLNFFTETSATIIATLDTAKGAGAGVSGLNKGYMMGGTTGSDVNVIEDLNFSTEASAAIAATLNANKSGSGGVSGPLKGYCMGGTADAKIEDLNFSTETSDLITATVAEIKWLLAGINAR